MQALTLLDYLAFSSLVICWAGYILFCRRLSAKGLGLVTAMHSLRSQWMLNYVKNAKHSPRIAEAQIINILQNNVSFYITITVFVIAGLMTMLSSHEAMLLVLNQLPYQSSNAAETLPSKILVLILIFIIAFFRLSWALRQGRYYAIALFALPHQTFSKEGQDAIANKLAWTMSISARSFNNAYHAYYFGLSALSWMVHPALFILTNIWVVGVIYRREFGSRALQALNELDALYKQYNGQSSTEIDSGPN